MIAPYSETLTRHSSSPTLHSHNAYILDRSSNSQPVIRTAVAIDAANRNFSPFQVGGNFHALCRNLSACYSAKPLRPHLNCPRLVNIDQEPRPNTLAAFSPIIPSSFDCGIGSILSISDSSLTVSSFVLSSTGS